MAVGDGDINDVLALAIAIVNEKSKGRIVK